MAEESDKVQRIPVEWRVPEHTVSRYATNLVIQRTEHEYVLSFFEVHPPIIIGEPKQEIESIQAECVARIIVAAQKMAEFATVIQDHVRRTSGTKQESD